MDLQEIINLVKTVPPRRPDYSCVNCGEMQTQEHHLLPQAHGGTKWRTVDLCATCHDKVHAQARVALSKKAETRAKQYLTLEDKVALQPIVDLACIAHKLYQDNKDLYRHVALQSVTIPVSPAQLYKLHAEKKKRGYTSMESFLLDLVAHITQLKSTPKSIGIGNRDEG